MYTRIMNEVLNQPYLENKHNLKFCGNSFKTLDVDREEQSLTTVSNGNYRFGMHQDGVVMHIIRSPKGQGV